VDAGAQRRQGELGYRDQDAAAALVADAEDFFAVCLPCEYYGIKVKSKGG
jgi:hypothetical protein